MVADNGPILAAARGLTINVHRRSLIRDFLESSVRMLGK